MTTLDRYIIRRFLLDFGILMVVLMLLFIVVDMIVGLDEFFDAAGAVAERDEISMLRATLWVIADYYGPVLLLIYVFFVNVPLIGAVGFAIANFQRTRELTAMVASGISMYRIALPILAVGIAFNALVFPVQELVIPELAPKLVRDKSQVQRDRADAFPVRFAHDERGRLFTATDFDATAGMLENVTVLERERDGLVAQRITADRAVWDGDAQGWRLEPEGRVTVPTVENGRAEAEPLGFIETELSPTVLMARRAGTYPHLLSIAELRQMQANPAVDADQQGYVARLVWSRFSMLVVNVLILIAGMVFFLQLGQVNLLAQAIKAAGLCIGMWAGAVVMIQVGGDWMNPVAIAWLPVVLYLPITAALLQWVRT